MAEAWEEFFLEKIKTVLGGGQDSLTDEEEKILLTPVAALGDDPSFTPEIGRRLQEKCTRALTEAYNRDIAGDREVRRAYRELGMNKLAFPPMARPTGKEAALLWRRMNEALYEHSKLAISGVVQNWYLTCGRDMERKAAGGNPLILVWVIAAAIFFLWLLLS